MFHYFGYGSNLDLVSLGAKGVVPRWSRRAVLPGWALRFNVRHWFRHEGGMANIQPAPDGAARVEGVVHLCEDEHLTPLDAAEAYGVGYDRIEVDVQAGGDTLRALTYVGLPAVLDDACLPTRRYLNILVRGAERAGLDEAYVEALRHHRLHPVPHYPPFEPPTGDFPEFDGGTLALHPRYTALAGAVFDMSEARESLAYLHGFFGGRDMTLFHLKRLDTSDGSETLDDVRRGHISEAGRSYLNAYLHEYSTEFRYVGRYVYDERTPNEERR